ncbi:MAG: hypothetical protein IJZ46_05300 [Bacilli bacterium]|nr:hypothetical protein [Bacillota bacterium]MBQ8193467.1 hypothetical protein [Bacilli bacterium]
METLKEHFTYNLDPDQAREIFIKLDSRLKELHSEGKYADITSETIGFVEDYDFLRVYKGSNEELRKKNIESLAKLAVGTYFSLPSGTFYDYSCFPTENLRNYFDSIESNIPVVYPEDSYYREVLVNGNMWYYNDYLNTIKKQAQGKGNNRVLTYSTPQGKAMTNKEEAAFVNLAFYPIIISLFVILSYMIYILVK